MRSIAVAPEQVEHRFGPEDQAYEALVKTFEALELPPGLRAELIGGAIVVSPTP